MQIPVSLQRKRREAQDSVETDIKQRAERDALKEKSHPEISLDKLLYGKNMDEMLSINEFLQGESE